MVNLFNFFEKISDETRKKLLVFTQYVYALPSIALIFIFLGISTILVIEDDTPKDIQQIKKDGIYSSVVRICIYDNNDVFKECFEFGDNKKIVKVVNKKVEFTDDTCVINIEVK